MGGKRKNTVTFYRVPPRGFLDLPGEEHGLGYYKCLGDTVRECEERASEGEVVEISREEIIRPTNKDDIERLLNHFGFADSSEIVLTWYPKEVDQAASEESLDPPVWVPAHHKGELPGDMYLQIQKMVQVEKENW
jgi:hypothetical protein